MFIWRPVVCQIVEKICALGIIVTVVSINIIYNKETVILVQHNAILALNFIYALTVSLIDMGIGVKETALNVEISNVQHVRMDVKMVNICILIISVITVHHYALSATVTVNVHSVLIRNGVLLASTLVMDALETAA